MIIVLVKNVNARKRVKKMNKGITITLITLLSILLVGVIGGMIFLMNTNIDFSSINIGISTQSKKLVEEKEITNIKDFNIESEVADIYIENSESSNIKVELYSDDASEYEITELDNQIKVVLKDKSTVKLFKKTPVIKIYAPKTYNKLFSINERTGDIELAEFENANLDIILTTGDTEVKSINDANIKFTTGDIEIEKANKVKLNGRTGDIKVGTVKSLTTKTTTGDVKVDLVGSIKTEVTTGDIEINNINNSCDLKSTTGDIEIGTATIIKNSKITSGTGDVKIGSTKKCYIEAKTKIGDTNVNNNDRKSDIILTITSRVGDIKVNY